MPNGNRFYVHPGGDFGPGLMGLAESLGQAGEIREKREEKEKVEAMKKGALEAYQSGDPKKMREFMIQNPEMAKSFDQALNATIPGDSAKAYKEALFSVSTDFTQAPQILENLRSQFAKDGIDPQEQAKLDNFQDILAKNPDEAQKQVESEFAMLADDEMWKRYQDIKKGRGPGKETTTKLKEYNFAKGQGYKGSYLEFQKETDRATKQQKTGAFLVRNEKGDIEIAAGSYDPSTGKLKTTTAPLAGYDVVSKLGETGAEETTRKIGQRRGETQVAGEEKRASELIDRGLLAAESTAVVRRAIELLETVKTGGIDSIRFAAKRFFGVEGADEGELSNSLGKAVLSQLRETFGAQFTESEGKRLERIEAGFSKSPENNKRLLAQVLRIANRTAARARKVAKKRGDVDTVQDIDDLLSFELTVEEKEKPASEMTTEELRKEVFGGS